MCGWIQPLLDSLRAISYSETTRGRFTITCISQEHISDSAGESLSMIPMPEVRILVFGVRRASIVLVLIPLSEGRKLLHWAAAGSGSSRQRKMVL